MQNLYEQARDNIIFRKFEASETLFTEYKCVQEDSIFKIWSQYNYFVYVLSGKKKWKTLRNEYMVYADEALFVKKGANIIHKFFEKDFCALMIFVTDEFIKKVVQNLDHSAKGKGKYLQDVVVPVELDNTLSAYFQSLYAYFTQDEQPPASLVELKFKELIINLFTLQKNEALTNYFRQLCYETKPSLSDIMEENFRYNLSIEEFARLSCRSLSSFKREFQQLYNMAPGRWLTQKRLEYARQLLEKRAYSINDLIFECGFENASHFIHAFKEKYNVTPHQYQKTLQAQH